MRPVHVPSPHVCPVVLTIQAGHSSTDEGAPRVSIRIPHQRGTVAGGDGACTARPLQRFYDQLTGGHTNRVLCWVPTELRRLVAEALGMTDTERAALTDDSLSTAIGKMFCNVISIRPQSSFSQYMSNSRSERRR